MKAGRCTAASQQLQCHIKLVSKSLCITVRVTCVVRWVNEFFNGPTERDCNCCLNSEVIRYDTI